MRNYRHSIWNFRVLYALYTHLSITCREKCANHVHLYPLQLPTDIILSNINKMVVLKLTFLYRSAALKSMNHSNSSQISHMKKSSKSSTKKVNSADNFIIKFHKTYGGNQLDDTALNDKRRIVFISLIGLFKSYKQCPSHILYTCLLVLPLKRKWIYNPNRYQRELQHQFNGMADDIFHKSMSMFVCV